MKPILMSFNGISKNVPNFVDVAAVFDLISKHEFTNLKFIYNKFKTVISFETTLLDIPTSQDIKNSKNVSVFELSDDIRDDYYQFNAACLLYACLVEGTASELAARRTAMENATKNANEVIQKLTMQYNRTRQAVITNELVDIITGASAL